MLSIADWWGGTYRWQMIPVYCSCVVLLAALLWWQPASEQWPRLVRHVARLGIFGLILSGICSYYYPVFAFPAPTGRYAVGTTSIALVDTSRKETCDPNNTNAYRQPLVRVWYPAIATNAPKAGYLNSPQLVPDGVLSHLGTIKTNASSDAPVAAAKAPYPAILYSPSWSGNNTDNTFQTEELASHGYVVFGIEHPCAAAKSVYPDGRVIYGKWSADYTSSDAALAQLLKSGTEQLELRTQDIHFVLDRLPELNRSGKFQGAIDLDRIGIFGHSFGGAAAAQACAQEPRLKAGMNMDGLLFGSVAKEGAPQPFMFMQSDYPRPTAADLTSPNGALRRAKQTDAWGYAQRDRWFQKYGGYDLRLIKSAHMNFSDLPLRSRRPNNGGGEISPDVAMKIINEYTVAFFDRHLQEKSSPLLDRAAGSPFPEVEFARY